MLQRANEGKKSALSLKPGRDTEQRWARPKRMIQKPLARRPTARLMSIEPDRVTSICEEPVIALNCPPMCRNTYFEA